jgi:hypothetical protein
MHKDTALSYSVWGDNMKTDPVGVICAGSVSTELAETKFRYHMFRRTGMQLIFAETVLLWSSLMSP